MIKILVNDGIHPDGKLLLEEANYAVDDTKIPQEELAEKLPNYDAIIVRSATKVRKELIDQCPNLKVIARGGVGMDNIDVEYARSKGIRVINTPKASSQSVAELVVGHLFTLSRFLHRANRDMTTKGATEFKALKKQYSKGVQLRGKTLGIIGFGRIGQEVARLALGLGMRVLATDLFDNTVNIDLGTPDVSDVAFSIRLSTVPLAKVFAKSDYITIHVPSSDQPVIGAAEMQQLKDGVFLVNTSRGGTIDEQVLLEALESGKVAGAALDVFTNEPTPNQDLLNHPKISVSPHIGASTLEAQRNIGLELADAFIDFFGEDN
ncbi:D-2-hydroxyacid dehydrogenase [Aureispira anguillae]|uniref:D-2-hydroxyacid dehydrogenase n=1 Tax=Aureispira anguillae TaxID=2864201 RepID=A0A915YIY7_9BACT|nr:D-2-hydroxyacid dehydrogenase [Aureispira anguillae]BDS13958.1 D-2-hydroxyacid dehydrogenase [Aureispira anguillae]